MHYRQLTLPILLVLTALAGQSFSQPTEPEEVAKKPAPDSPSVEAADNTPDPIVTTAGSAPTGSENSSQRSPYDYRSTEEISEDRSVSFPVDI